jgi:hypothetical protein
MQTNEEICEKIRQGHSDKAGPRGFFSKAACPCFRTCLSTAFIFFLHILALKIDRADAVPDLEPKLLDSNFVKPSKLQLLFRPSGKYAASTHYIHIRVPFNFSRLTLMPTIIFDRYQHYIEIWPEPHKTQVEQVAELSRSCLSDKHNDFNNMLDALPQHEVVTREKRFLDLVALGMSSAALTLATFNTTKISHLEMQIVINNKRLDHLVDITALHDKHFKAVDQKVDNMAAQLANILRYDKVKFSKLTDLMEQKLGTAVAISECLIHTGYLQGLWTTKLSLQL